MAYTVDKEISGNGYASVSLGTREEGGRRMNVAIKRVRVPSKERYDEIMKQYGYDKDQAESYFIGFAEDLSGAVNAMATLSQKDSRRIISVYEHSGTKQDDPLAFYINLVMEYLPSLEEVMSEKGLTLGQAVRIGMDICDALTVCHDNDVIHGGVKERNIFVNEGTGKEQGGYKLGDIGLSRILWDPTRAAHAESSHYMAPEIFKGEYAEEAADIYSIGIILYKIFNDGRMPFSPIVPPHMSGTGAEGGEERRRSGEIPPAPRKAGERLGSIIRKACGPKDRRQKTAKILKDELSKYYETLTDAEKSSMILHPPGAPVPGRRAMGQQRVTAARASDEEDIIWPSERISDRTAERDTERGTRGAERFPERTSEKERAEKRVERRKGRFAETHDAADEISIESENDINNLDSISDETARDLKDLLSRRKTYEREGDRTSDRALERALDGESAGHKRLRGTAEGRAIREGGKLRGAASEERSHADRKRKKREYEKAAETVRMPRFAVVAVLVLLIGGLVVGGFFVYNIFFNDPLDIFARHVEERDFASASDVFNERIGYNENLTAEARNILAMTLESTVQNFADGLILYDAAHSLWTQIHEISILDEDTLYYFNDEIMSIFTSQRAFSQGIESFEENEWASAILHLGRVGNRFHGYGEAQRLLNEAENEFRNFTIANLGLDAENIETYENALVMLNNALHILPGDPGIINQIDHVQTHLDALTVVYEPEPDPEPPPRTPNTELVENARLTFRGHTGIYTGEVAGGQPHGFGSFVWEQPNNRIMYEGQWNNGWRHGHGRQEFQDGGVYEGNWANGFFSGQGTFTYPDGRSVTSAAWSQSALSNAQGTVRNAEGDIIFEGNLSANQNSLTIP